MVVDMSERQLKNNIQVLYAFSFCWLALVIIPVAVPFFASKGLSVADVFVLQSIFALSVVVFEVPSGYLADIIGRRNALILGSVFHGFGFTLLCFADGFLGLALFEITVGLGMSLLSGSDLSLLYDTQLALNQSPAQKTRVIANMRAVKAVSEGLASLLASILVLWSFDAVVYANAIVAWFPLILSFFLVEAPYQRMDIVSPWHSLRRILSHLFLQDNLLRLTTLAFTFYGLVTFYVVWLVQPYWEQQGISLAWFGVLWALMNFTVAVAAHFCARLEERAGAATVLLVMGLLPILGYVGMAIPGGVVGLVLVLAFYISRGFHQVILTDAFNSRVPSGFRATANSLVGLMFRLTFIVTGPLVGYLYEWQGMLVTLLVLAAGSVLLLFLLLLPLLRQLRHTGSLPTD